MRIAHLSVAPLPRQFSLRGSCLFVSSFGVNVVPPTQPAFSGIESARFRMLRVGGMPWFVQFVLCPDVCFGVERLARG